MLTGRVFITGGAGFLARAIYKQAAEESWPCEFTAFSRDDSKHAALQQRFPHVRTIRGDVAGTDVEQLAGYMRGHDYVIHAAANKYVDLAEQNPWETMRVNVHGSENVALAAIRAGVRRVVGISTDKACEPSSTYGLSKAAMERLFLGANDFSGDTEFSVVRYGNVVGSTGSFIERIGKLKAGDTLSATNQYMTRFWMRPAHAVEAVVKAATEREAIGSILIPHLPACSVASVLNALVPPGVHIHNIGERKGEKLHEVLVSASEARYCKTAGNWSRLTPGVESNATHGEFSSASPPVPWFDRPTQLQAWAEEAAAI